MNKTKVIKAMMALELTNLNLSEGQLKKQYLFRIRQLGENPDRKRVDKIVNAYLYIQRVLEDRASLDKLVEEINKNPDKLYGNCRVCKGKRFIIFRRLVGKRDCVECKGRGYFTDVCEECDERGLYTHKSGRIGSCDKCKSTKIQREYLCKDCNGKGKVPYTITLEVPCQRCAGFGLVKVNVFNPVIKNRITV